MSTPSPAGAQCSVLAAATFHLSLRSSVWRGGQVRDRQAALEEALRIIHPLLRGETATFTGDRSQAEGGVLFPPPVQQPYVPILVAGGGEKTTLRFAACYADACSLRAVSWAGGAFTPDDAKRKLAVLDGHLAAAGRPPKAVPRSGLLAACLAESESAARAKFESLPPHLAGFFEQLPVIGTPEDALLRVRAMLEARFRYSFSS